MGEQLVSPNKKAALMLQKDGNLVLMCQTNNKELWTSGTCGEDVRLKIQVNTQPFSPGCLSEQLELLNNNAVIYSVC